MTTPALGSPLPRDLAPAQRHPAPDVVRSIALAGVIVMNFHGYLIIRGASRRTDWLSDLFDPWTGVLSTRFAATFVLVAGVGVTLMTRSAVSDRERVRTLRWRLASRGLALYAFGLAFDFIWPGTILPFYGAMFAVAALVFTLRTGWIVVISGVAALSGWALAWWIVERGLDGQSTRWLTEPGPRSIRGLVLDVTVNGTHPLLPWLAFFGAGIVVGRVIDRPGSLLRTAAVGAALVVAAAIARVALYDPTDPRARVLFSTEPFDRGLLYVVSALGSALVAFGLIGHLAVIGHRRARHHSVTDDLRRAGQASLSIYVLHALVFLLLVDTLGWISGGIGTALAFAAVVWLAGTVGAAAWLRHHERAPAEQIYRSLTR